MVSINCLQDVAFAFQIVQKLSNKVCKMVVRMPNLADLSIFMWGIRND